MDVCSAVAAWFRQSVTICCNAYNENKATIHKYVPLPSLMMIIIGLILVTNRARRYKKVDQQEQGHMASMRPVKHVIVNFQFTCTIRHLTAFPCWYDQHNRYQQGRECSWNMFPGKVFPKSTHYNCISIATNIEITTIVECQISRDILSYNSTNCLSCPLNIAIRSYRSHVIRWPCP